MFKNAIVAAMVCAAAGIATPATGQDSATAPWRIEARRVLREPGNHVDEALGALVVDQVRGEFRHEDDHGRTTSMPFDAIVAAHYERTTTGAWPLRRRRHFRAVVSREVDRTSIEVLRLSLDDTRILDALETDAGVTIDRTPSPQSFFSASPCGRRSVTTESSRPSLATSRAAYAGGCPPTPSSSMGNVARQRRSSWLRSAASS